MFRLLFLSVVSAASCFSLTAMQPPQDPCKKWHDFVQAATAAKHLDTAALQEVTQQVTKAGCSETSARNVPYAQVAYYKAAGAQTCCPFGGWLPYEHCFVLKTFGTGGKKE